MRDTAVSPMGATAKKDFAMGSFCVHLSLFYDRAISRRDLLVVVAVLPLLSCFAQDLGDQIHTQSETRAAYIGTKGVTISTQST